jgi:DNA-binding MarR family transcriptional regulator
MASRTTKQRQTACDSAQRILSAEKRAAWGGFLRAHSLITKALDADLIANFGLQLSAFEVLSNVERAPDGYMRMSDLAESALLSQSRVSRLVSELASGGLVERRSCPTDSRVVYAAITDKGRDLLRRVEDHHFEGVDERFFSALKQSEVRQLAALWPRVIDSATGATKRR